MMGPTGFGRALLVTSLAFSAVLGWACNSTEQNACTPDSAYPAGGALVLPEGLVLNGPAGSFDAKAEHSSCASSRELLVLRLTAPWCGTCEWHAAHDSADVPEATRAALRWVDVVVGDADNAEPTLATASEWSQKAPGADLTVIDPEWSLATQYATNVPLPAYLIVDPRSMEILRTVGNPSSHGLRAALNEGLAHVRGETAKAEAAEPLYDDLFTQQEWDMLRQASMGRQLLPDPSNRYADDLIVAGLGRKFFFETAWSATGKLSCESCHLPTPAFADVKPVSQGVGFTDRNAPTVLTASFDHWFFADGRADSAWMQALGPLEEANELGSSRLRVAHIVAEKHAEAYANAFRTPLPPLEDTTRFPAEGRPGDSAWDSMSAEDQDTVNRIFVNVGKSIAAYERSIFMQQTGFDRYATGELSALSPGQKAGLKEFFSFGCAQCHFGPTLANNAFHNLRFPTGRADGAADRGRAAAFEQLSRSEFSRAGRYSDAPIAPHALPQQTARYEGAFKTPTLRLVAFTAPYGHGGTIDTLDSLMNLYRTRGLPEGDPRTLGKVEPWVVTFDSTQGTHIVEFLKTFVGGATWW